MSTINTIAFGPTGSVGSAAARTAQQHGAKVFLAMRDPKKSIPSLSPEQEREGGFERVQADLAKPETVRAAVTKTGAKRAFIYTVLGTPDHMRTSIAALKDAGVEYVVVLGSAGVEGDIRSIPPTTFVPYAHAQVEVSLEEVFGADGFVAVRPAYFASNALWWKKMVLEGEVRMLYPEAKLDWISPGDIGRVCGMLVGGAKALDGNGGRNFINLCGPELVSQRSAVGMIGRAIGKDIKVTQIDEQEGLEGLVKGNGLPEVLAKELVAMYRTRAGIGEDDGLYKGHAYDEAVVNALKYGGRQPTKFQDWVDENRHEFGA